mmetsp:Transcript_28656/g.46266  ORF Transcript_28656/g.46266 Transcript_28656/m.46266 type:complete len:515 (-) Transcript_28656:60-1604(-)
MGGAVSGQSDIGSMVACTFMLGQALQRAFPEIYTVNDFHANKEKLERQMEKEHQKNMEKMRQSIPMVFLGPDGKVTPVQFVDKEGKAIEDAKKEEEEAEEEEEEEDVALDECLVIDYQGRKVPIKLDTIGEANEGGWNVLHAACHQAAVSSGAIKIIKIFRERGYDIDAKTLRGPGSYASGWTPLHMACAYGIPETVTALLAAGADVETKNSINWMPLHEAVHRGYTSIVEMLLAAGAKTNELIPSSMIAPYHPQYPLAHACRQGHPDVVKALLQAGADKDAQNEGGWTALHESVFFRHEECVQILLVYGADVSLKTTQGYAVFDFESLPSIRQALNDARPPDMVPESQSPKPESKTPEKVSYRLLGDLPELGSKPRFRNENGDDDDEDEEERRKRIEKRKKLRKKRKVKLQGAAPPEPGVPEEYACQLTGKILVDPVTTVYGNHYEKTALLGWIKSQGNICPVTGQPLCEAEVLTDKDLRLEISDWQLKEAITSSNNNDTTQKAIPVDSIYDF